MRCTPSLGSTSVLFAHESAGNDDLRDYTRDLRVILEARDQCPSPEHLEIRAVSTARPAFHSALICQHPDILILRGHAPRFGLFEGITRAALEHNASVLAALLSTCEAASTSLLLMGCHSSRLAGPLARVGLRGVCFDGIVHAHPIRRFLSGFFCSYFLDREIDDAFAHGCLAMAFDDVEQREHARRFGPELGLDEGSEVSP